jgi:hypothetical protein
MKYLHAATDHFSLFSSLLTELKIQLYQVKGKTMRQYFIWGNRHYFIVWNFEIFC